jgi:mRNA interferase MazF
MVTITQYDILLVNLDPTVGHEIKKKRPCVVISPDEMNNVLATLTIAPMTTKSHHYPSRVSVCFQEKQGQIVLDQIRSIDRQRVIRKLGAVEPKAIGQIKEVIREMLVD